MSAALADERAFKARASCCSRELSAVSPLQLRLVKRQRAPHHKMGPSQQPRDTYGEPVSEN